MIIIWGDRKMSSNKKKRYLLLIGIIMVFVFSAILGYTASESQIVKEMPQDKQEPMKQMPTFTKENNGEEYYLFRGEPFRLILPENPTTGYIWMVAEPTPENIVLVRQEYFPKNFGFPIIGGGGFRNMIFETIDKGRVELVIHLRRPWELEEEFVDLFTLCFEIK